MFRSKSTLTEAERNAIQEELARIESSNEAWVLSFESIEQILLAVKEAGNSEHRKLQREGIAAARDRGVRVGRPRITKPANFEDLAQSMVRGEVSRADVAKILGISEGTLRRWMKEYNEAKAS